MNIAQRLRNLMESQKLSNSKLARELGVHTSSVSRWLEGKDVSTENLELLCKYFNCSLDYLADATDTKKAPTQEGERPKSKLRSIARLEDSKITPEQDEQIADYIDFLLSKKKDL